MTIIVIIIIIIVVIMSSIAMPSCTSAVLKRPLDSDASVRDTFLFSFAKAKVSALEFDPETSTLYTASLHDYESKIYGASVEALLYPRVG